MLSEYNCNITHLLLQQRFEKQITNKNQFENEKAIS